MSHDHICAIVTGAAAGIGRELAGALLAAGARVLAVDIDAQQLDALARQGAAAGCGARLACLACDLADGASPQTVLDRAAAAFGSFNTLVCNAGIGRATYTRDLLDRPPRVWEVAPPVWRRFFDINTLAGIGLANAAAPWLLAGGWGRVVSVTTSLDSMLNAGTGPYGPSKAALEAYTAVLANELTGSGTTVNVLVPGGPVDTAMIPPHPGVARSALLPAGVMVPPLLWLLSRAADGVHGRRLRASHWDPARTDEASLAAAAAPIAWSALAAGQRRDPARTG